MGLALLTPLFLAGAALVAAPFLIHQIRRPEREPLRFSSHMFVPNIQREVIERKRVQHLLLLLLRMAMLILLAAAFSRPYWRAAASGEDDVTGLVAREQRALDDRRPPVIHPELFHFRVDDLSRAGRRRASRRRRRGSRGSGGSTPPRW